MALKKHFTRSVSLEIQLQLIKIEETEGGKDGGRKGMLKERNRTLNDQQVIIDVLFVRNNVTNI